MKSWLPLALCSVLFAMLVAVAPTASAKTQRRVDHLYERVWPAAVRFLRIDAGLKILERDAETGYVVFELEDDNAVYLGTLEVVRDDDPYLPPGVRLFVNIADRPIYMEHQLLDQLLSKLNRELGQPNAAPPKKKNPPDRNQDKGKVGGKKQESEGTGERTPKTRLGIRPPTNPR